MSDFWKLLMCRFCNNKLQSPMTLRCGHSICTQHLHIPPAGEESILPAFGHHQKASSSLKRLPMCPLPECAPLGLGTASQDSLVTVSSSPSLSGSPPVSFVAYLQNTPIALSSSARTDVTLNRLLALAAQDEIEADSVESFKAKLQAESTCEICFDLLYQPITTPCQHSFCASCLQRALDHAPSCPICRVELPGVGYFHGHAHNAVLSTILTHYFPEQNAERAAALQEDSTPLPTPIFVCHLSFPGTPTLLHFFEPRYRLMLRRALSSSQPQFGMIMSRDSEYGTMLEIRSVQLLSDGRSMVETWGTHRFRVLERGILDGYMVGRIERIDDDDNLRPTTTTQNDGSISITDIDDEIAVLVGQCEAFLDRLPPWVLRRLLSTFGPPPGDDIRAYSFWVALVLPVAEHEKARLLPMRSVHERLTLVVSWIDMLPGNWWMSNSCSTM